MVLDPATSLPVMHPVKVVHLVARYEAYGDYYGAVMRDRIANEGASYGAIPDEWALRAKFETLYGDSFENSLLWDFGGENFWISPGSEDIGENELPVVLSTFYFIQQDWGNFSYPWRDLLGNTQGYALWIVCRMYQVRVFEQIHACFHYRPRVGAGVYERL